MVYADYDYYKNEYFGQTIKSDDFQRLILRGSQYLDYITQGRAATHAELEAVKMASCAIAEQYQVIDLAQALATKRLSASDAHGAELQSQTVGNWSKSYRSGGDSAQSTIQAAKDAQSALLEIARRYLAHTNLLYRGGRRCT